MRKKSLITIMVLLITSFAFVFSGCNQTTNEEVVKIIDKSITEVYEGLTLQLGVKNTTTQKEVWFSSDESVATVSQDGLVTGLNQGKTTISIKVNDKEKDKLVITVKPCEVELGKVDNATIYPTKTLQLTATQTPLDALLTWKSENENVASVNKDGLVMAISAGTTTISATVGKTTKSITITVKDTVIDTKVNADDFDMTGLYQDNAVLKSNGNRNSFAAFNGKASKYYVASATVKVTNPDANDTWSRVGISHYNGAKYYGLQLSPGPNYNARKTVTMVINSGNVEWGTITDRSQSWNQHGVGNINFESVKLTTVRNGNNFSAYINDELYYSEDGLEEFTDVDTIPVLNLGSCSAEYTNMQVSYGEQAVTEFLETADASKFYASSDKVIIENDTIKFTGAKDQISPLNAKDHAAKHIGTNAVFAANVEGSMSFDLTIDCIGSRDALPALAITMNRYDEKYAEARSLLVGQYQAGWTGWNSNGDLNPGIGAPAQEDRYYKLNGETARLEEGATYKITVTRLMTETGQDNKLTVKDSQDNVLFEGTWGWNNDGYFGRASISFLCRDLDCTISNIVIK